MKRGNAAGARYRSLVPSTAEGSMTPAPAPAEEAPLSVAATSPDTVFVEKEEAEEAELAAAAAAGRDAMNVSMVIDASPTRESAP